jgi:alginate O-acetyltransferase complex protein AlgI
MIFSSIEYLLFLPLVVFLYWRTQAKARLALVVAASYYFYMSWFPVYGVLLAVMTTCNWLLGLGIDKSRAAGNAGLSRGLLLAGLAGNLGCLFYYKYTNFVITNMFAALDIFHGTGGGAPWQTPLYDILLPLGISFFVFEFVHYLVDVYKGDKPLTSWMEFAAFAAFFPSQIAGPIKRFQDFIVWLRSPLPWSSALFLEGMQLIVQGLFKKVAIADPLGVLINSSFNATHVLSAPDAIFASIGFAVQVYCDFSGYTDMGRGSALLLGIKLPVNFNLPYLAHDLTDFWRRWHMTLGSWLRDYVYIPMGGSHHGTLNAWKSAMVTMLICGLWHGAAWNMLMWGGLQGIGLILNREWRNFMNRVEALHRLRDSALAKWAGTVATIAFTLFSFTVFRAADVHQAYYLIAGWLNFQGDSTLWLSIIKSGVLQFTGIYFAVWLLTIAYQKWVPSIQPMFLRCPVPVQAAAWTAALIVAVAAKPSAPTPFIYFQF